MPDKTPEKNIPKEKDDVIVLDEKRDDELGREDLDIGLDDDDFDDDFEFDDGGD